MSGNADTESVYPGVFKRSEANYGYRANVPNGHGKQVKRSGFANPLAAHQARIAYLSAVGTVVASSGDTVAAWYQETIRARVLRSTTQENYKHSFSLLESQLGAVYLKDLNESHLRAAYQHLVERGYSTSTIRCAHDRLKAALKMAVREARIPRNCAENVMPPRGKRAKPTDTWSFEQLQTFAQFVGSERDRAMWAFWMTTGLRSGELCGLKWTRVDFGANEVRVDWQRTRSMSGLIIEGEVKTFKANRTVTPPAIVMSGLKEWQLAQPPSEYVFTSKYGGAYYPTSLGQRLKKLAARAGLPEISPHDLRHTFGTRAVENGMEIKLLSTLMGHSRVETTLNLYVHPNTEAAHKASEDLASRMFG